MTNHPNAYTFKVATEKSVRPRRVTAGGAQVCVETVLTRPQPGRVR